MGNPFVHIELNTVDLGAARQFYKKVFDWKLSEMPMGPGMTYVMVDVGKGTGGGMQVKPMADAPTMWLPYVEVASVKKAVAKAQKNGANVVLPYQPIPGMGAMGIFIDPGGAALGVWEPAKKAPARKPAKKSAKAKKTR